MCVAILGKKGVTFNLDKLDEGAYCNPDGSGYSYWNPDTNKVEIVRSLNWEDIRGQFIADNKKYGDRTAFMVHFRIKSHGLVTKDNCHPFRMADGGAFIHNGIINIPGIPDGQSDTRWFVDQVINALPKDWQFDPIWATMVTAMIGNGSKAVALWEKGVWAIYHESAGRWEDADGKYASTREQGHIWYSNGSCVLPSTAVLEQRKRAAENKDWKNHSKGPWTGAANTFPKALPAPGTNTSSGGETLSQNDEWRREFGAPAHPLPPYSRVRPPATRLPFTMSEENFEQVGEHTWRARTPDEIAQRREQRRQQALVHIQENLDDDDKDADARWREECLSAGFCHICAKQFLTRDGVEAHANKCEDELAQIMAARHGQATL